MKLYPEVISSIFRQTFCAALSSFNKTQVNSDPENAAKSQISSRCSLKTKKGNGLNGKILYYIMRIAQAPDRMDGSVAVSPSGLQPG
ncbi:hypothetical protein GN278_05040 [Rhodobacteraceae bacterium Araon29]